jgi:hypothetical protein
VRGKGRTKIIPGGKNYAPVRNIDPGGQNIG